MDDYAPPPPREEEKQAEEPRNAVPTWKQSLNEYVSLVGVIGMIIIFFCACFVSVYMHKKRSGPVTKKDYLSIAGIAALPASAFALIFILFYSFAKNTKAGQIAQKAASSLGSFINAAVIATSETVNRVIQIACVALVTELRLIERFLVHLSPPLRVILKPFTYILRPVYKIVAPIVNAVVTPIVNSVKQLCISVIRPVYNQFREYASPVVVRLRSIKNQISNFWKSLWCLNVDEDIHYD